MLSVIVCTYNRSEILRDCLDSLCGQSVNEEHYEVIVVDNNSSDATAQVAREFSGRHAHFRWVLETEQGLSHARNRGAREARYEWLLYIDDDALADDQMVERAEQVIANYGFDCFGGTYTAWFKYGKPRWMADDFGTKKLLTTTVSEIKTSELDGGLFCIRKTALKDAGYFPVDLGMKGNSIAYGEETALQERLLALGYKLGFDPELKMKHLVGMHKLHVKWHLEAEFARGKALRNIYLKGEKSWGLLEKVKFVVHALLVGGWINLKRMAGEKGYYVENFILDTLSPIYARFGKEHQPD